MAEDIVEYVEDVLCEFRVERAILGTECEEGDARELVGGDISGRVFDGWVQGGIFKPCEEQQLA